MTPKAKKLLDIVKRPTSATPERKVGGTDPSDPWSATSKISESPSLNKYLMSRGFDPKHITKDIKVAHSKSNQFKLWQQHHMMEDLTTKHTGAGVDHKTDLSVSPTKKRLNTLVKAKAHYNIPTPPGTMRKEDVELNEDDYFGKDASDMIKKSHEHHAAAQVAKNKGDHAEHERLSKLSSDTHKAAMAKAKEYRENPKNKASVERGINKNMSGAAKDYGKGRYMSDSVELDGDQLDEISLGDYKQKAQAQTKELKKHTKGEYGGIAQRMLDRRNKGLKMVSKREHKIETSSDVTEEKKDSRSASEKMSDYAVKRHKVYQGIANKQKELMKKWNDDHKDEPHLQVTIPEDVGSPMAAIKGVPVPESMAQKIKAMYKKKVVEDTYDSEKDDKYGQNPTFGKKPVMKSIDNKSDRNVDGVKTKAAAVLTGGTTLTGQKRDTVQIDPQLNNPRPGQTDPNGDRSNK
jgi:hypothetical protein